MVQYEELVALLGIENAKEEKEMLRKWIEKSGIEKVHKDCIKMIEKENKNKD